MHFYAQRVCRLCVAFQRINGFEAVYASGAVCGVTMPYHVTQCTSDINLYRLLTYCGGHHYYKARKHRDGVSNSESEHVLNTL